MNKSLLFLPILLLTFGMAKAQNECRDALPTSILAYNNGNVSGCVSILSGCMASLKTKEEIIEARRLLALCYLSLNETDKMHENIKLLMQHEPNYGEITLGKDPKEFSNIIANYTVRPNWQIGLRIGGNATQIKVIENNQFYSQAKSSYKSVPSYSLNFALSKNIGSNLYVAGNFQAVGAGIQHELQLDEWTTQNYSENIGMVGFAADLGYHFSLLKKYQWDLFGTLAYNQMYSNKVNINLSQNENSMSQHSFDRNDQRNKSQPTMGIGVNMNFPVQKGTLGIGISYTAFLNTTIKKEELHDVDFNFTTSYVNDLIKFRQVGLFFSYTYPINFVVKKVAD